MEMTNVKKHIRKRKNGASVVRKHTRKISTHRTVNGRKEVFVDGFWKHDDFPDYPKKSWSIEHLLREKKRLSDILFSALHNTDGGGYQNASSQSLPSRKSGLLFRRIKKITRLLKNKGYK